MGVLFETDGQPPIAGRIFGLLLLSDDALSLDELAGSLGVSKASASTNARLLAQLGRGRAGPPPGSRRDYYRIAPDLFERTMAQRLARWQRFTEVIGEARRTLPMASASAAAAGATRAASATWWTRSAGRCCSGAGRRPRRLARTGSGR